MRLSQITLSGVVLLAASASAQQIEVDLRPARGRTGASPAPVASQLPPAPVNGSDACATADVLGSVTGAIPYDNTNATVEPTIGQSSFTGGYCNYGCAEYGTGQVAVLTDVWFSWVAPAAGLMRVTSCPVQNDTKIGIYSGPACPTGTTCLSCNDDYHFIGGTTAGLLDSILYVPVVASQALLIQVGQSSFNTAQPGFVGTFNIDMDPAHETGAVNFDDNSAEVNLSFGAPGDGQLGLNRYANASDVTTLSGVQVCWGWTTATPGRGGWTAGHPAYVGLWTDGASQDGDPTDATLVETVATTIQSPGTDTYVTVNFTQNHTVNGVYFLGYGSVETAAVGGFANFPVTGDNTSCNVQPNTAWFVANVAAPNNLTTLASNTTPPTRVEAGFACQAQGVCATCFNGLLHSAFAIRANIVTGPPPLGNPECFGDSAANCPCTGPSGSGVANPGGAGRGCAHFGEPDGTTNPLAGAILTAIGTASVSGDTVILTCSNMTGPGLFFQSTGLVSIVNFNDGRLCAAGGGITRLGVVFPTAGVADYPGGTTPAPISIAGGLPPSGGIRHYQVWYRDAAAFCNVQTHNLSQGLEITWVP